MVVQTEGRGGKTFLFVGCALELELYFWKKKMRITKK